MHYLIFVHGMGDSLNPTPSYDKLLGRLKKSYTKTTGAHFDDNFKAIYVRYKTLSYGKEKQIFDQSFLKKGQGFKKPSILLFYRFLHYFMTFYLGDVIAYSESNEVSFRRNLIDTIIAGIDFKEKDISFSVIAHSLGSVISIDLFYNLFRKEPSSTFFDESNIEKHPILRNAFRNFYTFGSPIELFLLRKFGYFSKGPIAIDNYFPDKSSWINFYEKTDMIAYPIKSFPKKAGKLFPRNVRVRTGYLVLNSHVNYWKNRHMAKVIAEDLGLG